MRRVLSRLVAVLALTLGVLLCGEAGSAVPLTWRTVAAARGSSDDYTVVSITKKVVNGRAARIYVRASTIVRVHGEVMCAGSSGFRSRNYVRTLRNGHRVIPLPLTRAECTYLLGVRMKKGGSVRLRLDVLF
jgi:hypothetical protein